MVTKLTTLRKLWHLQPRKPCKTSFDHNKDNSSKSRYSNLVRSRLHQILLTHLQEQQGLEIRLQEVCNPLQKQKGCSLRVRSVILQVNSLLAKFRHQISSLTIASRLSSILIKRNQDRRTWPSISSQTFPCLKVSHSLQEVLKRAEHSKIKQSHLG